jgi:MSHA biogenesis protein MshL
MPSQRTTRAVEAAPRSAPLIVAAVLLAGCASATGPAGDGQGVAGIRASLEADLAANAALPPPPPRDAAAVAVAPAAAAAAAADAGEPRFDVAVTDMPAADFFRGLVAGSDANMVVHPGVQGNVTLSLSQVTLGEVMEVMRDVYGYDSTRHGSIWRVHPDALRTEVFQVEYLDVERTGVSDMQVSAGRVSDAGRSGDGRARGAGDGAPDDAGGRGGGAGAAAQVVGTRVNTASRSDFFADLGATLEAIVAGTPGNQVIVTPQTGLVVVRARPAALRAVREYLDASASTLTRQVILEAKILEVTLNAGFESGIDWHTFGRRAGGSFAPRPIVDADGNTIGSTPGSNRDIAGAFVSGTSGSPFNPLGGAFTLHYGFSDFEGMLRLLATQGTVQVLSSPRIATLNNQKAVIKVGSDEFFVTDVQSNTVNAGSAVNVNESVELTPFFSGIALDVTPQVSADGTVTLHVHPTVSEVREQPKTLSGDPVPLARSTIRESDSIVRARSGQVVVIGGLMQDSAAGDTAAIPVLGRLPLLGNLFGQKQRRAAKSELVILLRPIVVDDAAGARALGESVERVRALERQVGGAGST